MHHRRALPSPAHPPARPYAPGPARHAPPRPRGCGPRPRPPRSPTRPAVSPSAAPRPRARRAPWPTPVAGCGSRAGPSRVSGAVPPHGTYRGGCLRWKPVAPWYAQATPRRAASSRRRPTKVMLWGGILVHEPVGHRDGRVPAQIRQRQGAPPGGRGHPDVHLRHEGAHLLLRCGDGSGSLSGQSSPPGRWGQRAYGSNGPAPERAGPGIGILRRPRARRSGPGLWSRTSRRWGRHRRGDRGSEAGGPLRHRPTPDGPSSRPRRRCGPPARRRHARGRPPPSRSRRAAADTAAHPRPGWSDPLAACQPSRLSFPVTDRYRLPQVDAPTSRRGRSARRRPYDQEPP